MLRKSTYSITLLHLLFQLVYMTLGQCKQTELGTARYIFYLFRAEYMVISGMIALIMAVLLLTLFIRGRRWLDALMLTLNLEYIAYYVWMIMQQ